MDINLKNLKFTSQQKRYDEPVSYDFTQILGVVVHIGNGLMPRKLDKHGKQVEFTLLGDRLEAATQLIHYFFNDPKFKGNLSAGLWLHGKKGTGKTMLLKIFREMAFNGLIPTGKGFNLAHCGDIVAEYESKHGGAAMLGKYHQPIMKKVEAGRKEVAFPTNWGFDDLGAENRVANHFQNTRNVMQEILEGRYRMWTDTGGLTFLTSNFNMDLVKEHYDKRVEDRFYEMFNDIKLDGESLRRL